MDDLTSKLSQILNSPDGINQLKSMAASLGLTDDGNTQNQNSNQNISGNAQNSNQNSNGSNVNSGSNQNGNSPDLSAISSLLSGLGNNQNSNQGSNQNGNSPDLSAISSLLSGLGSNQNSNQGNNQNSNSPDLSAISSLLSGLGNNQNNNHNNNSNGGFDLSALTSMLSGAVNQNNNQNTVTMPNIDINMIMKLQQAMSQLSASDKNVELLLALKPHFGDDRRKKVDDAIRIMQIIKLLPLIKESGLFGGGLF